MSCSPFDIRDYFLQELPDPQQRQVEAHVKTCQGCQEELDRLNLTGAALASLRDEEIPQRIAFVSDKIFEPSPVRRWWAAFWGSTARLGFASAAMLSTAILVYALRPAAPVVAVAPPAPQQVVQTVSDAEIQARVDAAVTRVVAQLEARQTETTKQLVADLKSAGQQLRVAQTLYEFGEKRGVKDRIASANYEQLHEAAK